MKLKVLSRRKGVSISRLGSRSGLYGIVGYERDCRGRLFIATCIDTRW